MNIVVDTSVWSLVLRRHRVDEGNPHVAAFRNSVERGDCIHLIGHILQELLDGILNDSQFERLLKLLQPFPLVSLTREVFIRASRLRNSCRRKGILASPTDFLIAACCIENGYPLLTSDRDFQRISSHCDLALLPV